MKLVTALLFVFCLQASATGISQTITYSGKEVSLEKVFQVVKEQTGYFVSYKMSQVRRATPVTIQSKDMPLEQFLHRVLQNQPLDYTLEENTIFIKWKKELYKMIPLESISQTLTPPVEDITLSGRVTNDKQEPLEGVSVTVRGTQNGTITNADGRFSLSVPSSNNVELIFSFVGFESQTVRVGNQTVFNIILKDFVAGLDDVVVVGYGTQKKANITGAISTMNSKQLSVVPAGNTSNLLAGQLPGLIAVQRSSEPGNDQPELYIRGFGTPLVVVDGIVGRDFSRLDPNEIESISILKDAASTAVYGVNGGNGVILVTTKKGTRQKPELNYTFNYGVQHVTRYPRFVNSAEFAELKNEASYNIGGTAVYSDEEIQKFKDGSDPLNYPNFDYYNYFVKDYTPQKQHNISVRGGGESIRYFFMASKFDQEAMWKGGNQNYGRYNFRSNVEANIGDNLTIDVDLGGRTEDRNNLVQDAYLMASWMQYQWPISNPLTPDGKINNANYGLSAYLNTDLTGYIQNRINTYQANVTISYKIPFVPGLSAKVTGAHDMYEEDRKQWMKEYGLYTWDPVAETSVKTGSRESNFLNLSNTKLIKTRLQASLNYARRFADKHNVTGLLLYEEMEDRTTSLTGQRIGYVVPIDQIFAGPQLNQTTGGTASDMGRRSYVGRVTYDYFGKYLLEYSFRYDGSPLFPVAGRWGYFSGYSAGWRVSDESFFKNHMKVLDYLKLRASYGTNGYDGAVPPFQYVAGYNYPSGTYVYGGATVSQGFVDAGIPNPEVTWQRNKIFNIGADLGFWGRMLELEIDVFQRTQEGLFGTRATQIPSTFGASLPQENINSDIVKGFEVVVRHNHRIGQLSYNVAANVSFSKRRWDHYETRVFTSDYDRWMNDWNDRYTNRATGFLKAIGQFQSQEEIDNSPIQDGNGNRTLLPGDIKFDDFNGDGIIDSRDIQSTGYGTTPELMYGLNLNASWKKFNITVNWQGATNFQVHLQHFLIQPFANDMNTYAYFLDRWRRADAKDPNSEWIPGKYPATRNDGSPNNRTASTFWLKNATYFRLKALNIGYTVDYPWLGKAGIKAVNIFVSGQNLLTFTGLEYMDPETPSGRLSVYPLMKTYNAGINVTF
ncbi:MAG: TonB-dependent receptor [Chitinophagaceae bacterium]|nr:TonB-dependent receptor [Chitinophagaceae bacterium]